MRLILTVSLMSFAACNPSLWAAELEHCATMLEAHIQSDMALDYKSFDQTPEQGFRVLAGAGCHGEAADLIEAYLEHNEASERSLIWHVAQMRAMAGQTDAAIAAARKSLKDSEAGQGAFRWNDYVLATIAFLEKDRNSLKRHRDAVASMAEAHRGNAVNLKLLDALVRYFERDYAFATLHIE